MWFCRDKPSEVFSSPSVPELCLIMRRQRTVASPARGSASGMGTSSMSSMPPMMSGGRPAAWPHTGTARKWASSPARDGECWKPRVQICPRFEKMMPTVCRSYVIQHKSTAWNVLTRIYWSTSLCVNYLICYHYGQFQFSWLDTFITLKSDVIWNSFDTIDLYQYPDLGWIVPAIHHIHMSECFH